MFNGMVVEAAGESKMAMIQQIARSVDTPWYEDLMQSLQRVWGDLGLVALCVMVVVLAFIFKDSIGVVVKRIFGK